MVDNRGISPINASQFKSDNASANKMSEEKYGQGGEYFAQEMDEEPQEKQVYQDRSAQLRASLNGLAMANAGSIMLMKTLKEKEDKKNIKNKDRNLKKEELQEDEHEKESLED